MPGEVARSLKASEMSLLVVIAMLVLCSATFAGLVIRSAMAGVLTPTTASQSFPYAAILMATAIGLLQSARSFDRRHPRFMNARVQKIASLGRRTIIRISGR